MKFTHDQDGTHYVLWRVAVRYDMDGEPYTPLLWCVETGWGSGYGQWVMLYEDSIAWPYLTEKMPGLRDGDKPGLINLFAKAGLEVFG